MRAFQPGMHQKGGKGCHLFFSEKNAEKILMIISDINCASLID